MCSSYSIGMMQLLSTFHSRRGNIIDSNRPAVDACGSEKYKQGREFAVLYLMWLDQRLQESSLVDHLRRTMSYLRCGIKGRFLQHGAGSTVSCV